MTQGDHHQTVPLDYNSKEFSVMASNGIEKMSGFVSNCHNTLTQRKNGLNKTGKIYEISILLKYKKSFQSYFMIVLCISRYKMSFILNWRNEGSLHYVCSLHTHLLFSQF